MVIVRALPFLGSLKKSPRPWVFVSDRRMADGVRFEVDVRPAKSEDFSSSRSSINGKSNGRVKPGLGARAGGSLGTF